MTETNVLMIEGEVDRPAQMTFEDLCGLDRGHQIEDVSRLAAERSGDAVTLAGLLSRVQVRDGAKYIGLHSSTDEFHASIPLEPVRNHALLIYRRNGQPLPVSAGGPLRFFIPDSSACQTTEIDECANVKFVDRIELTAEKGFDNRPSDEQEHEELHRRQGT